MPKKTETPNPTEATAAPAKQKRTIKPKHPLVIEQERQLNEARMLSKVYDLLPKLSEWGACQILAAAEKRVKQCREAAEALNASAAGA